MTACTFSCPSCGKQSTVQSYGGMSDIDSLNCNRCPMCVHIDLYDPNFSGPYMRYGYTAKLDRKLERLLRPCKCGGKFERSAPYRCPLCLSPFTRDEVTKHIGQRIGFLVMSAAVRGEDYWINKKDKPTLQDRIFTMLRILQAIVTQWAMIFRGIIRKP